MNEFSYSDLIVAHKIANEYYLRRRPDGTFPAQKEVAEELGIAPPRFSEFLQIAQKAGMIDVIITPPDGVGADRHVIMKMESKLLQKLQRISPAARDRTGRKIHPHRLLKVHVVPGISDIALNATRFSVDQQIIRANLLTRICKRAARAFHSLIVEAMAQAGMNGEARPVCCGISWSRTCEQVVNLMGVAEKTYPELVICPLIGLIGHRENTVDANFLAFRLASRYSASSIILPCPCVQPIGYKLENLKSIARALQYVGRCCLGISGIGEAFIAKTPFQSTLLRRGVIDEQQVGKIQELGGVAEISCHFLDSQGNVLPYEELGFIPVGVTIEQMRTMKRFMIVVSPDRKKILPLIAAIKAGICTDIVLEHTMAHYILDEEHDEELGLTAARDVRARGRRSRIYI